MYFVWTPREYVVGSGVSLSAFVVTFATADDELIPGDELEERISRYWTWK